MRNKTDTGAHPDGLNVSVSRQSLMRISIIRRNDLDKESIKRLTERVAADEHLHDKGACTVWGIPAYFSKLYVVIEIKSQSPIGILYAGGPPDQTDAAWWIDSLHRKKGYASEAVDLFAKYLKANGVTGVGAILVDTYQGKYDEASHSLVKRFKDILYESVG